MIACIYLRLQDNRLNSIELLCVLLEKIDVQLLLAEISAVSY